MPGYIDAVIKRLGDPTYVNGDEHRFRCLFCPTPDSKGHLFVNEEEGFFCHRCNTRGKPPKLLALLGITEEEVRGGPPEIQDLWRRLIVSEEPKPERKQAREVTFPSNCCDVSEDVSVQQYARYRRGLTEFQCNWLGLKAWIDIKGNRRLLFPDEYDGKMVYWTARAIEDHVEPKYDSAPDSDKSLCVWNLWKIRPAHPIYVCEGIFSALACGSNGVAIYGKYLSYGQARMLAAQAGPQGVRIVLDREALDQTFEAGRRLQGVGVPVGAVVLPSGEDPDSVDRHWLAGALLTSQILDETGWMKLRTQVV